MRLYRFYVIILYYYYIFLQKKLQGKISLCLFTAKQLISRYRVLPVVQQISARWPVESLGRALGIRSFLGGGQLASDMPNKSKMQKQVID